MSLKMDRWGGGGSQRLTHLCLAMAIPQAIIQRTIVDSPAFLVHGLAEKVAVCAHTNRDPNKHDVRFIFVWSGSELWSFSNIQKKIKKSKTNISGWWLFKAYPMIPLSGRDNLAGRFL